MTPEEIRKQMMGSAEPRAEIVGEASQTPSLEFASVAGKIVADAIGYVGRHGPIIIDEKACEETALDVVDLATIDPIDGSTSKLHLARGAAVIRLSAKNAEDLVAKIECIRNALEVAQSATH